MTVSASDTGKPKEYKVIRIFVASPGDLAPERFALHEVVREINDVLVHHAGMHLEVRGWESVLPQMGERAQSIINKELDDCVLFVMLLWKRWGSPTGEYGSGTEEEYNVAKRHYAATGENPFMMVFFKDVPEEGLGQPDSQLAAVLRFRRKIESNDEPGLYDRFGTTEDWRKKWRNLLASWLSKHILPWRRRDPQTLRTGSHSATSADATRQRDSLQSDLQSFSDQLLRRASGNAQDLTSVTIPASFGRDVLPCHPEVYVRRADLEGNLLRKAAQVSWLALVGVSGCGKTQLALSVSERWAPGDVWWVRLEDQPNQRLHLRLQLGMWGAQSRDIDAAHSAACSPLLDSTMSMPFPPNLLLVVDNLPDSADHSQLYNELTQTARAIKRCGGAVLTTGQRSVSASIATAMSAEFESVTLPPLTTSETRTLLANAGAPKAAQTRQLAKIINSTTDGLPVLVAAVVDWLRRRDWILGEDGFRALIRGEPTREVREIARRVLARSLDDKARSLLYRLTLVRQSFTTDLAIEVASVPPAIALPGECIDEMRGPWLETTADGRLRLTPLLRDAGSRNVAPKVRAEVHATVARHYMSKGVLSPTEAHSAFLHLWDSDQKARALTVLVQLAISAHTPQEAQSIRWVTWVLSPDTDWPSDCPDSLRIMVRAAQVRCAALAGAEHLELDSDMERLIAQAGKEDELAVLFAYANTGFLIAEHVPSKTALARTARALQMTKSLGLELQLDPEGMIWLVVFHFGSIDDMQVFVTWLHTVSDDQRRDLFSSDLAIEVSSMMIDRLSMVEAGKPKAAQDWESLLAILDEIEVAGQLPHASALMVAQARCRANILHEIRHAPSSAVDVLDRLDVPENTDLRFLLAYTKGCILDTVGSYEDALDCFEQADREPGDAFGYYRLEAKMRLAMVLSHLQRWASARSIIVKFFATYRDARQDHVCEHLEMMGELAWILWQEGQRTRACSALHGLVIGTIGLDPNADARHKEVFLKAQHGLVWYVSKATLGTPPLLEDSGEDYYPVSSGFFGIKRTQMAEWDPPSGLDAPMLLSQLGALASATGLHRLALRVSRQADLLAGPDHSVLFEMSMRTLASLNARLGSPEQAVRYGLRATKATVAGEFLKRCGSPPHLENHVDELWSSMDAEERQSATTWMQSIVLAPAVAELLGKHTSLDTLATQLTTWSAAMRDVMSVSDNALFVEPLADFLSQLAFACANHQLDQVCPKMANDNHLLKALWYLFQSYRKGERLHTILATQVYAIDFFMRGSVLLSHVWPGLGMFLHTFWDDMATKRRFALNSPEMFARDLARIPKNRGIETAVKVIRAASSAVGVRLPCKVSQRFHTLEDAGYDLAVAQLHEG